MSSLTRDRGPRNAEPADLDSLDLMDILCRYAASRPVTPAELAAARARYGMLPDGTVKPTRYELARRARAEAERRRAEREAMAEMDAECRRAERTAADALWWTAYGVGWSDGQHGRLYSSDAPSGLTESERGVWRSAYLRGRRDLFNSKVEEINGS